MSKPLDAATSIAGAAPGWRCAMLIGGRMWLAPVAAWALLRPAAGRASVVPLIASDTPDVLPATAYGRGYWRLLDPTEDDPTPEEVAAALAALDATEPRPLLVETGDT